MPPSNGKRFIKVTFAMFALAGVLGALTLIERSSPAPRDESINALPAAFTPGGGDSGAAFTGSLEAFTSDQFAGASGLTGPQNAAIQTLAKAGLASSPDAALSKLGSVPDLGSLSGSGNGGQRAIFRAIAGDVFKTLRALFRDVPGAIGDKMRRMLERMARGFLGGGGGGGGGTS